MLYPILFKPIYKEMVWGGSKMAAMPGRTLPFAHTGESWDISCRPDDMGVVENGPDAGLSFAALLAKNPPLYLGAAAEKSTFPLLVKIIDASDHLSVQVHPTDDYAYAHENGTGGKSEMWYVMDAPDDGCLIIGLRDGVNKAQLQRALSGADAAALFNRLPVKKGDIINIPAGLIHAITKGTMVAEIQQNADITYRLYDYNRKGLDGKPRPLHLEAALAVADCENALPVKTVAGLAVTQGNNRLLYKVANAHFAVIQYAVADRYKEPTDGLFSIFTCVEGCAHITVRSCDTPKSAEMTVEVPYGRSVFIPAGVEEMLITGACVLLKSFAVDDAKKILQAKFIAPLQACGYTAAEIVANTTLDVTELKGP